MYRAVQDVLDRAYRDAFPQEGNEEYRPEAQSPRELAALGKLVRLRLPVSDVDDPPVQHASASEAPTDQRDGELADHAGRN